MLLDLWFHWLCKLNCDLCRLNLRFIISAPSHLSEAYRSRLQDSTVSEAESWIAPSACLSHTHTWICRLVKKQLMLLDLWLHSQCKLDCFFFQFACRYEWLSCASVLQEEPPFSILVLPFICLINNHLVSVTARCDDMLVCLLHPRVYNFGEISPFSLRSEIFLYRSKFFG